MHINIPLRNNKGEITAYALIDEEDHQYVDRTKWYRETVTKRINGTNLEYARNGKKEFMHHLVFGKAPPGQLIDHINHNGLDNRKSNLRFATRSQNAQNSAKTPGSISQYLGVTFEAEKWRSKCAGNHLGRFEEETEAAKAYDLAAFQLFGKNCANNNLLSPEEIEKAISTPFTVKANPLPKGVERTKNQKYSARIKTPEFGRESLGVFELADEAHAAYQSRLDQILKIRKERHYAQPILRDENSGKAMILMRNAKKEITGKLLVLDDEWHLLTEYTWYLQKNSINTSINRKIITIADFLKKYDRYWTGEVIKITNPVS